MWVETGKLELECIKFATFFCIRRYVAFTSKGLQHNYNMIVKFDGSTSKVLKNLATGDSSDSERDAVEDRGWTK